MNKQIAQTQKSPFLPSTRSASVSLNKNTHPAIVTNRPRSSSGYGLRHRQKPMSTMKMQGTQLRTQACDQIRLAAPQISPYPQRNWRKGVTNIPKTTFLVITLLIFAKQFQVNIISQIKPGSRQNNRRYQDQHVLTQSFSAANKLDEGPTELPPMRQQGSSIHPMIIRCFCQQVFFGSICSFLAVSLTVLSKLSTSNGSIF